MKRIAYLFAIGFAASVMMTIPATVMGQLDSGDLEANRATAAALEQRRSVDIDEPAGQALSEFSVDTDVQFIIHVSAIESGFAPDSPVVLVVREARLSSILDIILEPHDCTYEIRDGIVRIVSDDFAKENPILEVIDCNEFLASFRKSPDVMAVSPANLAPAGGVYSSTSPPAASDAAPGSSRPVDAAENQKALQEKRDPFEAPEPSPPPPLRSAEEQLIKLIEDCVAPGSWVSNGGDGRIQIAKGKLIVTTTNANLRQIRTLLEELR